MYNEQIDNAIYEIELQGFRPEDEINPMPLLEGYRKDGLRFIDTASHGYLVVPLEHELINMAHKAASSYSYKGKHALYLEEDRDAPEFMRIYRLYQNNRKES